MTFTSYIERQKSIIRSRHEGEMYYSNQNQDIRATESERIFAELISLGGLNKRERQRLSQEAVL